jgi:hypothetical protein
MHQRFKERKNIQYYTGLMKQMQASGKGRNDEDRHGSLTALSSVLLLPLLSIVGTDYRASPGMR